MYRVKSVAWYPTWRNECGRIDRSRKEGERLPPEVRLHLAFALDFNTASGFPGIVCCQREQVMGHRGHLDAACRKVLKGRSSHSLTSYSNSQQRVSPEPSPDCKPGMEVDSMREAVFIVSPKTLNLGSLVPTRPVTQFPVWMPMRMLTTSPLLGIRT